MGSISSKTISCLRSSIPLRARLTIGEPGELVITTLTKEAIPLIRYRTRDITTLIPNTAPAAHEMIKKKTMGRTDDMLIIKGVNVFPSQIEAILMQKSRRRTPLSDCG